MPYNTLLLLFLLSLGFPVLLPAGAATVLYVKPTIDTPCPSEPCHTLAQYATRHLISVTAIEFLPGTYNLSKPLHISGINNLSLLVRNATRNATVIWISRSEALHFPYHATNGSEVNHSFVIASPVGSVGVEATERNERRSMAGDVNVSHYQCGLNSLSGGACGCPSGRSLSLGDPEYCLKCSNI